MKFYWLAIVAMLYACGVKDVSSPKLVWADEFDYSGTPDSSKWNFNVGDGCPRVCGWGNNELQYYTENALENARVENGHLVIEARLDSMGGMRYTSARLTTKGKGDWKYGRIEVRSKLPQGRGTWPAIWMLPTVADRPMQWPRDGEIDIMEHVGYNQGMIVGSIHTEKYNHIKWTQKSDSVYLADVSSEFHTYALDWTEEKLIWLIDDEAFLEISKNDEDYEGWPFDQPFHLILNIAVGGNWGGKHGVDDAIWPQQMVIDYVRVYQ